LVDSGVLAYAIAPVSTCFISRGARQSAIGVCGSNGASDFA
jgi:hypothetical protein